MLTCTLAYTYICMYVYICIMCRKCLPDDSFLSIFFGAAQVARRHLFPLLPPATSKASKLITSKASKLSTCMRERERKRERA